MITQEIESTFYKVKVAHVYAHLNKQQYFAGYSLVIKDQAVGFWEEFPIVYDNETIVNDIAKIYGLKPEFAFNSKLFTIFYCPSQPFDINGTRIQPYLEVINSFNGHVSNKNCIAFKIGQSMFYTDLVCSNMVMLIDETNWISKLFSTNYNDNRFRFTYPAKLKYLLPTWSATDNLSQIKEFLPLINEWSKTSFMEARKLSIKLFNHLGK